MLRNKTCLIFSLQVVTCLLRIAFLYKGSQHIYLNHISSLPKYSQVPNKFPPCLLIFQFFSSPPDLIGTPYLLLLRKLTFFTNPSFYFLSLLVLFTPNFHSKIAGFCLYFSFMLHDNLSLLLPILKAHLKAFLKFRPPHLC